MHKRNAWRPIAEFVIDIIAKRLYFMYLTAFRRDEMEAFMPDPNNRNGKPLPMPAYVASAGLAVAMGLAGVLLTPVNLVYGILLLVMAAAVGLSLIQSEYNPDEDRRSGRQKMDDLYYELEMRREIFGEKFEFMRVTPERSLTRRL